MMMKSVVIVVLCLLGLVRVSEQQEPATKGKAYFWLCLERCGGTKETIAANLKQIEDNKDYLTGISFEMYNIGPNSTLVGNNLTIVAPQLKQMGLETYPMVSSYPYPKNLIDWLRQVWADPDPFIAQCISEAKKYGYTGYNLDWEPTEGATAADAQTYSNFLAYAGAQFHAAGLKLTVAAGTWSPIWNFPLFSKVNDLDKVCTMSTYTTTYTTWIKKVDEAVQDLQSSGKLAIGLMTPQPPKQTPYNSTQLKERFDKLLESNVEEIWIWKFSMALPDDWWVFVKQFVTRQAGLPQDPIQVVGK